MLRKREGLSKKTKLLPGIKRKAILGAEFSARKLDAIADLSLESGTVAVMGRSLGCQSQATRQKDAFVMRLYLSDNQEAILVKWMASPGEEKKAMRYLKRAARRLQSKGRYALIHAIRKKTSYGRSRSHGMMCPKEWIMRRKNVSSCMRIPR